MKSARTTDKPTADDGSKSYLLIQELIEKTPFCEDCQEGLPDSCLKIYSLSELVEFDETRDIVFETEDDLVAKYYQRLGQPCPHPIESYVALYGKTMTCPDGCTCRINELLMYFNYYGIEMENLYFIRKIPTIMAVCDSEAQGCELIQSNQGKLRQPKVVPVPVGKLMGDAFNYILA